MDYDQFKGEIFRMTGIDLNAYKERQMKRRLESLVARNDCSDFGEYVDLIGKNGKAYDEFINYLTINVSEFFRNGEQWKVLDEKIIPYLMGNALGRKDPLKIWSTACSTGDEPYSLAMLFAEHMPFNRFNILATDIDQAALEKAKNGFFNEKSLKGLPDGFMRKYFKKEERGFRISELLKAEVDFSRFNLLENGFPYGMDLVVCRNVLIYFTDEAKNELYRKFNRSLKDGGILFVGSTEQIIRASRFGFESIHSFFYRKVGPPEV